MKRYSVEITDLFGGELNYSYVTRMTITAKSMLGAIQQVSRKTGLHFRKQYGTGDWEVVYHSTSRITGCTIDEIDDEAEGGK